MKHIFMRAVCCCRGGNDEVKCVLHTYFFYPKNYSGENRLSIERHDRKNIVFVISDIFISRSFILERGFYFGNIIDGIT